nr:hypothetical protein I302_04646 [Kwoniella bestiolae CBS 10118]OCF26955.1 hypothetical protein I302_04646 [Kwoniella bestiolae CBS 10118]
MRDNAKRNEVHNDEKRVELKDTYILWNDGCGGDVFDGYQDKLPKPISLVGVVQMMVGERRREMDEKKGLMDLITL